MNLNEKQIETRVMVEFYARLARIDPAWAVAVAFTESSLGLYQRSPTGCKGVFNLSSIAVKDLLIDSAKVDDDFGDITMGIGFLRLLLKRWGSIERATNHYCDPDDRDFYIPKILKLMKEFER